ncbi:hypothetical protein ABID65_009303 [Bradyrhizobium sp. S3.9.2]|uniref:hypothetical protein n=1 Tax=Bradyrhizobium sp. S3.9.2 TaxID=3156432 RepID=UPI003399AD73
MNKSYLVQILLPKERGDGEPVSLVRGLPGRADRQVRRRDQLVRAPGQGLWRNANETERDNIAVIEVMAAKLAPEYWRSLRERLERELSQEEIVIRAQEIIAL